MDRDESEQKETPIDEEAASKGGWILGFMPFLAVLHGDGSKGLKPFSKKKGSSPPSSLPQAGT